MVACNCYFSATDIAELLHAHLAQQRRNPEADCIEPHEYAEIDCRQKIERQREIAKSGTLLFASLINGLQHAIRYNNAHYPSGDSL